MDTMTKQPARQTDLNCTRWIAFVKLHAVQFCQPLRGASCKHTFTFYWHVHVSNVAQCS